MFIATVFCVDLSNIYQHCLLAQALESVWKVHQSPQIILEDRLGILVVAQSTAWESNFLFFLSISNEWIFPPSLFLVILESLLSPVILHISGAIVHQTESTCPRNAVTTQSAGSNTSTKGWGVKWKHIEFSYDPCYIQHYICCHCLDRELLDMNHSPLCQRS